MTPHAKFRDRPWIFLIEKNNNVLPPGQQFSQRVGRGINRERALPMPGPCVDKSLRSQYVVARGWMPVWLQPSNLNYFRND
jgi:hypothetical protein